MKTTLFLLRIFLACAMMIMCTAKKSVPSQETAGDSHWAAMDDYHRVMASAFHPFKDSSNLGPIKKMSQELAQAAEKWASAPLPEKVNNEEMKAKLERLKAASRDLADHVKTGASDDVIGKELTELHEGFHEIMEKWERGKGEHEAH